ncbi:diacylglycerol kinase [Bowmanella dokdonensis]|uniref:Diacylglycerol kinase n=1 Tax=Bowmanella dokdonensis TaxID=751969 RepID=A0A939DNW1_9ALTE|nr:diacylglycerol kinase [Bowmanella dokdonensis]MBN7825968.1 diacylglycerol kinase [Bowmanella dokdonensis]
MEKPNGRGFRRLLKATHCSIDGLGYAIRHEAAFRQELLLSLILVPLAFWLTRDPVELLLLVLPLLLLLLVECLNSAVEASIDRISTVSHPLSKQAKDLGSAAVFIATLMVVVSWLVIGLPKML